MPSGTKPPTDEFNRAVMGVIRSRMNESNYTSADRSRLAGVAQSTLSRYLSDHKHPPIVSVRHIAIALKISMTELVTRAEAELDSALPPDGS